MKTKKWFSIKEIQEDLFDGAISKTTLLKRVADGQIPSIRFANKIFVPACWVEQQLMVSQGKAVQHG